MTEQAPFDLAIIGTGPAGYVAAIRAGQLGLKTAVIERDSRFGGTCLLRGCIPTKALLNDAHLFQEVRKAARIGLFRVGEIDVNFRKVQERKTVVVDRLTKSVDFLLRKNKVTIFKGSGTIVAPGRIGVTGEGVSNEVISEHIIIATGSEAKSLPGYDVDERNIISNVGALDLTAIPKSMVIVGAGAVGVEFASIYNGFGTKVTLIEALPTLVPIEDAEIGKELRRVFTKRGMDVYVGARLEGVSSKDNGVEVTFQSEKGEVRKVTAEKLLMATGRAPNTANIGLEAIGVATKHGVIQVNEFMETNVNGVFAVGDVTPSPLLAHVASQEGIVAVERIAGKNPAPINYGRVPSCTYCEPQVGSVGLTEARAIQAGHEVKIGKFPFTAVSKARIADATDGFVKVVADAKYGEILGVHMIGTSVTELIAEATASMELEATVDDLIHTIHAHPTLSEGIHEAMENVFGSAIHM